MPVGELLANAPPRFFRKNDTVALPSTWIAVSKKLPFTATLYDFKVREYLLLDGDRKRLRRCRTVGTSVASVDCDGIGRNSISGVGERR